VNPILQGEVSSPVRIQTVNPFSESLLSCHVTRTFVSPIRSAATSDGGVSVDWGVCPPSDSEQAASIAVARTVNKSRRIIFFACF